MAVELAAAVGASVLGWAACVFAAAVAFLAVGLGVAILAGFDASRWSLPGTKCGTTANAAARSER